jgi:hypothetical protein
MKHWDDLRDIGLGCLVYFGGVVLLVRLFQWLINLI